MGISRADEVALAGGLWTEFVDAAEELLQADNTGGGCGRCGSRRFHSLLGR